MLDFLLFLFLSKPSFDKDIKPIFTARCYQCHNVSWADKNWTDYKIAFRDKEKIKLRLKNNSMPPGNYTNMSKEERELVIKWIDTGAKK